ncbi:MAG: HNH endonuclease [Acidimicrobiia bacterium]
MFVPPTVPSIGSFDAWGGWQTDDAASLPGWLSHRCGLSGAEANRLATRAKRLRQLPLTQSAWLGGRLRSGHVDAVVANTSARNVQLFAEHEAELVPALARLDVHDARTVMQRWAVAAESVLDENAPQQPEQSLYASRAYGDRLEITASLVGNAANTVEAALRLADSGDLSVGAAERRAEALGVIAEHYLDHQHDKLGGRHRPHVNIVIDVDRLSDHRGARTIDGFPVDPATAAQLCCDAAVHRVVMAGSSTVLELCRATRVVSASQFTALVLRDGGCRFPGCGRMARHTQAHHIWAWEDGGPTNLDNLVLLCSRHHHRCHAMRYETKLLPNGEFHVAEHDGTTLVSTPRAP